MLEINPGKVRFVITQARMFDAKEEVSDPDSGSNASDDMAVRFSAVEAEQETTTDS